jgi:hypothetical protein
MTPIDNLNVYMQSSLVNDGLTTKTARIRCTDAGRDGRNQIGQQRAMQ